MEQQREISGRIDEWLGDERPAWLIVCGSGLAAAIAPLDRVKDELGGAPAFLATARRTFSELGVPSSSVPGHAPALVLGVGGNVRVLAQTGRLHPYEGHAVQTCVAVLRAVIERGTARVALTSAVGALGPRLAPGQVVCYRDQINLWGPTPLVGPHFLDCSALYDADLRREGHVCAGRLGIALQDAVYAHARGPQYETPAEVAALATLGGDVVGMSTTYEAIAARAAGARVLGLGLVTNVAGASGLSHDEVLELGRRGGLDLARLLVTVISDLSAAT